MLNSYVTSITYCLDVATVKNGHTSTEIVIPASEDLYFFDQWSTDGKMRC